MNEAGGFLRKISEKTSFPCDIINGQFHLELRGRDEMYLCGCKKIMKYGEEEIIVRAKYFDIVIKGKNLTCASFHCSGIVINGNIGNIEFSEGA